MKKKLSAILLCVLVLFFISQLSLAEDHTATRDNIRRTMLMNNGDNNERNEYWIEDLQDFKNRFPNLHKNLFHTLGKNDFNTMIDELIDDVDKLDNPQLFVRLGKIVAAVGDAHTTINYWDGYRFPLEFRVFGDDVYIVNTDTANKSMMYSKVISINDVDINKVKEMLSALVPHENEYWLKAMLTGFLSGPVYMYGLGIINSEDYADFTIEKDGAEEKHTIKSYYGTPIRFVDKRTDNIFTGKFSTYYQYDYMQKDKAYYIQYNACGNGDAQSFEDFCVEVFDDMANREVEKVIVDLRSNSGGNSSIFDSFSGRIGNYLDLNGKAQVFVLIGRDTFSSGVFAIMDLKQAAPSAIIIGEPTGGAVDCYGELGRYDMPNSQLQITYCKKYFELSKVYGYEKDTSSYLPDVTVQPDIQNYINNEDVALEYLLKLK